VLATQRPAGIVGADIKANVNLRIALRVRDRADSDDVVDAPDAARIDVATPGRALCRSGSGPLRTVQVARVNGAASRDDTDAIVVRVAGEPAFTAPAGSVSDDLTAVVRALQEAARRGQMVAAPAAWLPPLPGDLLAASLPEASWDEGVALGVVDLPERQSQPVLRWHPVYDGHLGLCGGPRSGRTSALLAIALALAHFRSPRDLHLQVIDAASGHLSELGQLPHTGSVLTRDQPRLVARLVARLTDEVRARLAATTAGAGGRSAASATQEPPLVLLIDGWDALVESLDQLDHGRSTEALLALLRDGRAAGLRAVVTGDEGCSPRGWLRWCPSDCCCGSLTPPTCCSLGCPAPPLSPQTHHPGERCAPGTEPAFSWSRRQLTCLRRCPPAPRGLLLSGRRTVTVRHCGCASCRHTCDSAAQARRRGRPQRRLLEPRAAEYGSASVATRLYRRLLTSPPTPWSSSPDHPTPGGRRPGGLCARGSRFGRTGDCSVPAPFAAGRRPLACARAARLPRVARAAGTGSLRAG
jgi:hypothetical protein